MLRKPTITQEMKNAMLGVYAGDEGLWLERKELMQLYAFYGGKPLYEEDVKNEETRGQSWEVPLTLDYTPTRDIRNHTKRMLHRQARFMFGMPPIISFKPRDKAKKSDGPDAKVNYINDVLMDSGFWCSTMKAFLDATIGKRVLMLLVANPGEEISIQYYNAMDFTYQTDPFDYRKLIKVTIAFQDRSTMNNKPSDQLWHRWQYYFNEENDEKVMLNKTPYDGNGKPIGDEEIVDTELSFIPAYVIANGGLLGDTDGVSDVYDLIDPADTYNRTISDYRDALKFRMFEQAVFIDADPKAMAAMKIAPNAVIDLKSDPAAGENAKADAKMLSAGFNFKDAAEFFLDNTKTDMYEIMDQPRPEDVQSVESAKAMRFIFFEMMARCEEKWNSWEPAIRWLIRRIIEVSLQFNLHLEDVSSEDLQVQGKFGIKHRYPIPEDEETMKTTAIAEVAGNVRSIKSYIREFAEVPDVDDAFNEIIEEIGLVADAQMSDPIAKQMQEEANDLNKEGGDKNAE